MNGVRAKSKCLEGSSGEGPSAWISLLEVSFLEQTFPLSNVLLFQTFSFQNSICFFSCKACFREFSVAEFVCCCRLLLFSFLGLMLMMLSSRFGKKKKIKFAKIVFERQPHYQPCSVLQRQKAVTSFSDLILGRRYSAELLFNCVIHLQCYILPCLEEIIKNTATH